MNTNDKLQARSSASPAKHIADAFLWLGGLVLVAFAMAIMFFWLAGDLTTYGGVPEWMKIRRPGSSAFLQLLNTNGLRVVLRILGTIFAFLGLFFVYGMISEVVQTLRGGVPTTDSPANNRATRAPRRVLRSALKAKLNTAATQAQATPPHARAAHPTLTADERSFMRGTKSDGPRIESIVSRCPGCGTLTELRTIRNYICAECRGRVLYISMKTGEALPDAARYHCVQCDAEKFSGILTCVACGYVDT